MEREKIIKMAEQCEFSNFGIISADKLDFMTEVRDMCAMDRCNKYEKSWTCPPACGTLEEVTAKAREYSWGIVVQTTEEIEDSFDFPRMVEIEEIQKKRFKKLTDMILDEEEDALPMGVGACTLCEKCTYPDSPCRFPDKAFPSMEAYGLLVTKVCEDAQIGYYYGPGTLTYTSLVLMK